MYNAKATTKTLRLDENHIFMQQLNLSLAVSVDRVRLSRLKVEKIAGLRRATSQFSSLLLTSD